MDPVLIILLLLAVYLVAGDAFLRDLRQQRRANPEGNCLGGDTGCPLPNKDPVGNNAATFVLRQAREGDTLLPDGRMEHYMNVAPDPSSSYRDLFD